MGNTRITVDYLSMHLLTRSLLLEIKFLSSLENLAPNSKKKKRRTKHSFLIDNFKREENSLHLTKYLDVVFNISHPFLDWPYQASKLQRSMNF